ncbi:MAG: hypothetical protein ACHQF4_09800 [Sphingobacteriales bacterium]
MKSKILLFLLIALATLTKAQTKEETTDWLSQHISTESFTDISSGRRMKEELKSISCDNSSLKIKWEHTSFSVFNDGNDKVWDEEITVPLSKIISINTYQKNSAWTIRIITTQNSIISSLGGSYKDYFGDDKVGFSYISSTELYFKYQSFESGEQNRIIRAFNHLAILNKQDLPKEVF